MGKEFYELIKFGIVSESKLENNPLITARIKLGISAREFARSAGLYYLTYLNCESGLNYPTNGTIDKIINFFDSRGVALNREEVFPEKLRGLCSDKNQRISKKTHKEFFSFYSMDVKDLPCLPKNEVEDKLESRLFLNKAFKRLNDKEREVIYLRYGFDNGKEKKLEEVGERMGLTRQRIHQIESDAIRKIKKFYNESIIF